MAWASGCLACFTALLYLMPGVPSQPMGYSGHYISPCVAHATLQRRVLLRITHFFFYFETDNSNNYHF